VHSLWNGAPTLCCMWQYFCIACGAWPQNFVLVLIFKRARAFGLPLDVVSCALQCVWNGTPESSSVFGTGFCSNAPAVLQRLVPKVLQRCGVPCQLCSKAPGCLF